MCIRDRIIGDNSIGKSLLLHKMTNYKNLLMDNKTKIQEGYEKYLEKNNIGINTCLLYTSRCV